MSSGLADSWPSFEPRKGAGTQDEGRHLSPVGIICLNAPLRNCFETTASP